MVCYPRPFNNLHPLLAQLFPGDFPWLRIRQDSSGHADLETGDGGLHVLVVCIPGWWSTQRAISSHSSLRISSGSTSWNGPDKERPRIKTTRMKISWKSCLRPALRFTTWGAPYLVNTWWPRSPCQVNLTGPAFSWKHPGQWQVRDWLPGHQSATQWSRSQAARASFFVGYFVQWFLDYINPTFKEDRSDFLWFTNLLASSRKPPDFQGLSF